MNPTSQVGGAENSLLELVSRVRNDVEFHIVTPGDGPLTAKAEASGAKVWNVHWPRAVFGVGEAEGRPGISRLGCAAPGSLRLVADISQLLREIRCDVLISNGIKCHILGAFVPRGRKVPLIWYLRDGLEHRTVSRKLLSLLAFRCDAAICISNYIAGELRAGTPPSLPIHVLYNIVDQEKFRPGLPLPADLRKEAGEVWFGVVGAVTGLKGQDLFLEAAGKVARLLPSARFLIVGGRFYGTRGDAEYRKALDRLASSPLLGGQVLFLGYRDDVPAIIANLDVLVVSNRRPEGLGRSLLEAMSCAVPVVSVDRWGPGELVRDGENGLSFPVGDTEALADRMLRLARDPEMRAHLGTNGRNWIRRHFVPEEISSGFLDILDGVLKKK